MACIIVASSGTTMHSGAAGCIGCIIGGAGQRRPAGTGAARDALSLRVIGRVTRLTWHQPPSLHLVHPASRGRKFPRPPARPSAPRHAAVPQTRPGRIAHLGR